MSQSARVHSSRIIHFCLGRTFLPVPPRTSAAAAIDPTAPRAAQTINAAAYIAHALARAHATNTSVMSDADLEQIRQARLQQLQQQGGGGGGGGGGESEQDAKQ